MALEIVGKPSLSQQKRFLNVHEYVGLDLMNKYGVSVPQNEVATTPEQAGTNVIMAVPYSE